MDKSWRFPAFSYHAKKYNHQLAFCIAETNKQIIMLKFSLKTSLFVLALLSYGFICDLEFVLIHSTFYFMYLCVILPAIVWLITQHVHLWQFYRNSIPICKHYIIQRKIILMLFRNISILSVFKEIIFQIQHVTKSWGFF